MFNATQQVIHALNHSFNRYLSSIHYLTGTVSGTGDTEVKEIDKIPASRAYNLVGRDNKQMNML